MAKAFTDGAHVRVLLGSPRRHSEMKPWLSRVRSRGAELSFCSCLPRCAHQVSSSVALAPPQKCFGFSVTMENNSSFLHVANDEWDTCGLASLWAGWIMRFLKQRVPLLLRAEKEFKTLQVEEHDQDLKQAVSIADGSILI